MYKGILRKARREANERSRAGASDTDDDMHGMVHLTKPLVQSDAMPRADDAEYSARADLDQPRSERSEMRTHSW